MANLLIVQQLKVKLVMLLRARLEMPVKTRNNRTFCYFDVSVLSSKPEPTSILMLSSFVEMRVTAVPHVSAVRACRPCARVGPRACRAPRVSGPAHVGPRACRPPSLVSSFHVRWNGTVANYRAIPLCLREKMADSEDRAFKVGARVVVKEKGLEGIIR